MPDELKPVLARQMEVYAGFPSTLTTTSAGRDALDDLGVPEDTLVYTSSATTGERRARSTAASTKPSYNGARRRSRRQVHVARTRDFGTSRRTTTRRRLGARDGHAYQWTKRYPRTGEERATARSCTGQVGSRPEARCERVPPCDRHPHRARSRQAAPAEGCQRYRPAADRGVSMAYLFDGAPRLNATGHSISRCSATAASTTRAGPGHATRTVGDGTAAAAVRRGRLGALRHQHGLSQARPAPAPESWPSCSSWPEEASKYNVLPLDDRRVERFNAEPRRPAGLVKGNCSCLQRHGTPQRAQLINIKNKSHAVTAGSSPGSAPRAYRRPGGAFAGWACTRRLGVQPIATIRSARSASRSRLSPYSARTHQVRMEFAYDGGGSAKGTVTALPRRRKPVRVTSSQPCRCSSPWTRPPTWDEIPRLRSATTTKASSVFTGTVNWVQIDLGDDAEDATTSSPPRSDSAAMAPVVKQA
jgi:arylsulfatase